MFNDFYNIILNKSFFTRTVHYLEGSSAGICGYFCEYAILDMF